MFIRVILMLVIYNLFFSWASAQKEISLLSLENEKSILDKEIKMVENQIDSIKWDESIETLISFGLPSRIFLRHMGFVFEYAEDFEQAKWVAHVITPDIVSFGKGRSNDFRTDSLVSTGTAEEIDYFVKTLLIDSTYEYDGYGYDRGHLAPSADFRWSEKAVSESYYYSNMSPMLPDFNRGIWADLESFLRQYVLQNKVPLYVITAPILHEDLETIERSINGVKIPEEFVKFAYDPANQRVIAFVLDNQGSKRPLSDFAMTGQQAEERLGFKLFDQIDPTLKQSYSYPLWSGIKDTESVTAIPFEELPANHWNTISGAKRIGDKKAIKVCGTVVSSRNSRSGNAWLNLDQKYPNDYFSVMIQKEDLVNFDHNPVTFYLNHQICVEGQVSDLGGKPVIFIEKRNKLNLFE